eukprot:CAMPEP_0205833632 /NCGR_PEP_ID=MMETSP0206-20130828/50128_1 /ASSEMBLY_ACC=CAM_ASM_000279 /TAXON_ID=36767 /ORGANISM="Euplotes focardii, Strain TN1" /LENGTH=77 /DNA_ID=CAMNT_0053140185 /DNA_START=383 /DNA_END=616 /DNA_ORIENTATION=-
MAESTYKCTIEDCLNGLYFAIDLGWYDYATFDTKTYERYEKVENGDMNWIVPKKFLAVMTLLILKLMRDMRKLKMET